MLDKNVAVSVLNTQALARAKINAENFKNGIDKKLKYGESKCARYVKKALIAGGASAKNSGINQLKIMAHGCLKITLKLWVALQQCVLAVYSQFLVSKWGMLS
ncbi:hypothetical protein ACR70V_17990 [Klebsiella pneumoniae]|uniref:hypothetical protein n=1 Tax=Klebsiella TaxID=570 RepID=UPI00066547BA|nr:MULTISPECIES: hypothetical protein [Klebsiella]EIV5640569.1 hypothetical protein [Klebsiella pneumoniae]EJA1233815.1 hypothetical protein [Klebsiella pneumoniae]EKW0025049.1 hypothetical protein [Klebsiella pneumoniae]EKW2515657.1 hypothetical protein [Klebsiella pneumoniae]EKX0282295.1 hypothetical protein [Klebsiella pneumoniae]